MAFLNASLLFGGVLIALPILLHLLMRRQPRPIVFPALRFVLAKRDVNQRQLRLRHLLLLLLRCAAIALLAFALARPSWKGSGVLGKEGAPLAAAIVVDTSLRMEYTHDNATRLAIAKEIATGLLNQLPEEGVVSISDLSGIRPTFSLDNNAALQRLEQLTTTPSNRPLVEAVLEAIQLLQQKEEYRQELFVCTDLSAVNWDATALQRIAEQLKLAKDVALYIVDVGLEDSENIGFGKIQFSELVVAEKTPITLRLPIQRTGPKTKRAVEIVLGPVGKPKEKRGTQQVEFSENATAFVEFSLAGLTYGTHQGRVQLVGEDALSIDNARYFTLFVQPPRRVLLLGETTDDAVFLNSALTTSGKFECHFEQFSSVNEIDLKDFSVLYLLDPPPLPEDAWKRMTRFAEEGGGVAICLGHRAVRDDFNEEIPQALLAGKLLRTSRQSTYLGLATFDHPILSKFRRYAKESPWNGFPVDKMWELNPLADRVDVVQRYTNRLPALVERPIGSGRALTLTTPLSDPSYLPNRPSWNFLPTGLDTPPWPFWLLANEMTAYLAGGQEDRQQYAPGEMVTLHLLPDEYSDVQKIGGYALLPPEGDGLRRSLPPGSKLIQVTGTNILGNYQVVAGGENGTLKRGFSVNGDENNSYLQRAKPEAITAALGENRVRFARKRQRDRN